MALAEGGGGSIADWELGELRCRLACVYRAFGGELWVDRKNAHAQLLQAAQIEGPAQVSASSHGNPAWSLYKNSFASQAVRSRHAAGNA